MNIANMDCFEYLETIGNNSIDCVLVDPPYGTIKGRGKNTNIKSNADWDIKLDTSKMFEEIERVLRPGGVALIFSQEPYTSELITNIHPNMTFSTRFVWLKNNSATPFNADTTPLNRVEDICVFHKLSYDKTFSNKAQEYALKVLYSLNVSLDKIAKKANVNKGNIAHFFTEGFQFRVPQESVYNNLVDNLQLDKLPYFIAYNDLKKLHEDSKLNFKRTYNLPYGCKSVTNVLEYKRPNKGVHPTQKPVDMLSYLIELYTNVNDSVLDFTMGSGSTGVACKQTNRNFYGCELNEEFYNIAVQRLK